MPSLSRWMKATAEFLQKFYEKGLAEFAFRNGVSLHGHFRFQSSSAPATSPIDLDLPRRTCVPVGGGKDSIVTIECLQARRRAAGAVLVG